MSFKEKIYQHYTLQLGNKIAELEQKLNDLAESLQHETKSTAGDKHETARAFVHIEQENTGRQLSELQEQRADLAAINIHAVSTRIIKGSLVKTNKGYLFVSIAQGKAIVDGQTIFALSPAAPLGRKLLGLSEGDIAAINEVQYTVEQVL